MTLQTTPAGGPAVAGIAERVRQHLLSPLKHGHCR